MLIDVNQVNGRDVDNDVNKQKINEEFTLAWVSDFFPI